MSIKLTATEAQFADLIWRYAPVPSPDLVKLAEQALGWKKSTTYTMLKRLCGKGVFQNENATVTALFSREQFYAGQSRRYVEDAFGGSLPRFFAAFLNGGTLSDQQAAEIKQLIKQHKEE